MIKMLMLARTSLVRAKLAAGGGAPSLFTFQGTDSSTSDLTAYTFASKDIGTAAANRRVIVGGTLGRSSSGALSALSTLTVGGVSATIIAQNSAGNSVFFLACANVTSGSTGDIVVTGDDAAQRCMIGYWVANVASTSSFVSKDETLLHAIFATKDFNFTSADLGSFTDGFAVAISCINGDDTSDRTASIDAGFRTPTELFIESQNAWFSDKTTTAGDITINAGYSATGTSTAGIIIANWAA